MSAPAANPPNLTTPPRRPEYFLLADVTAALEDVPTFVRTLNAWENKEVPPLHPAIKGESAKDGHAALLAAIEKHIKEELRSGDSADSGTDDGNPAPGPPPPSDRPPGGGVSSSGGLPKIDTFEATAIERILEYARRCAQQIVDQGPTAMRALTVGPSYDDALAGMVSVVYEEDWLRVLLKSAVIKGAIEKQGDKVIFQNMVNTMAIMVCESTIASDPEARLMNAQTICAQLAAAGKVSDSTKIGLITSNPEMMAQGGAANSAPIGFNGKEYKWVILSFSVIAPLFKFSKSDTGESRIFSEAEGGVNSAIRLGIPIAYKKYEEARSTWSKKYVPVPSSGFGATIFGASMAYAPVAVSYLFPLAWALGAQSADMARKVERAKKQNTDSQLYKHLRDWSEIMSGGRSTPDEDQIIEYMRTGMPATMLNGRNDQLGATQGNDDTVIDYAYAVGHLSTLAKRWSKASIPIRNAAIDAVALLDYPTPLYIVELALSSGIKLDSILASFSALKSADGQSKMPNFAAPAVGAPP